MSGGIATRRSILAEKEGGGSWGGNAATRRGQRREPYIAEWVSRHFGISASGVLYAKHEGSPYLATPDLLGDNEGGEIKTTTEDWSTAFAPSGSPETIPSRYLDQCYWGMFVTNVERWLFVWEQHDENGPTGLEPKWFWITRDDRYQKRILELKAAADRFMAWREAGAPNLDADLPEHVDEALSKFAAARLMRNEATAMEKEAEAVVRKYIAETPGAEDAGLSLSGSDAGFTYSVTYPTVFDRERLAERAPAFAARLVAAEGRYTRSEKKTRLTMTPHKGKKAAA